MTIPNKTLADLVDFLVDTDDESKKDAVTELRANKVNVTQFFARVQQTVQTGYSKQLEKVAVNQQSEIESHSGFLDNVSKMTRDAMLTCFEHFRQGNCGIDYREAALARCRNKDTSNLTDEELRSWLEDISEILGEPKDEE